MRLCFDATRFGFGLKEAVELCAHKKLPAVEYTFEPFSVAGKNASGLQGKEKTYLCEVEGICRLNQVEVACINLNYCLDSASRLSVKQFNAMAAKLCRVASAVGCRRFSFWLKAGLEDDWMGAVEEALTPLLKSCAEEGIKPVLRLSTPGQFHDQSLRKWRPLEPQDWRDILAALPDLCLAFCPADCVWQGIDYLQILPAFAPAIEHVEARDVEINRSLIADSGLFGPLWWRYRLPGKGQTDWRQVVEALMLYEYKGHLSICLDDEFIVQPDLDESLDSAVQAFLPYVRG